MERKQVTREIVLAVKEKLADPKYKYLTYDDIDILCGTSGTTVSRVRKGHYDHLLNDPTSEVVFNKNSEILKEILNQLRLIRTTLVSNNDKEGVENDQME